MDRASDILEPLVTHVLKGEVEPPGYVLLYTGRYTDTTGLGQTFQPSRDIHPVTKDVVVLYHYVALVNADPELNALVARRTGISLIHPVLPFARTTRCIDDTRELDQQTITGRFDDAPPVFGDLQV